MKKTLYLLSATLLMTTAAQAQTNPSPWVLNTSGNYSFTSFSPASPSFPTAMAIHQMSSSPVTLTSTPVSDVPLPCVQQHATRTNVWALGNDGIGLLSNPVQASPGYSNGTIGEVVLALNTTGRTAIHVSYMTGTAGVSSGQSAVFRLRCQYRVGSSGPWSEMGGGALEYETIQAIDSVNVAPFMLPAAADNKPLVQVRWVYYHVSGAWANSNNRSHRVRLDNVSVTSYPIVTLAALNPRCPTGGAHPMNAGSPAGGTYAGPGVTGGNLFNPTLTGTGTFPITYTYTDAFGMTNFAVGNITVDYNACVTNLTTTLCGATNVNLASTLWCNAVTGAQDYEWRFENPALGYSFTKLKGNTVNSMPLSAITGLSYGNNYNVSIRVKINNQWANWGNACQISLLTNVPSTQLSSCGATGVNLISIVYCNPVTAAQDYEWEFSNAGLGYSYTYLKGSGSSALYLSQIPGLTYGNTYNVRVRAKVGGMWGAFGPVCTMTMLNAVPVTQVVATQCGATGLTNSSFVYCNAIGAAQDYEWTFANSQLGYSYTYVKGNTANTVHLNGIPGLLPNTTYNVTVRAKVGGVWGNYGNACEITMGSALRLAGPEEVTEETQPGTGVLDAGVYPNPISIGVAPTLTINGGEGEVAVVRLLDLAGKELGTWQLTVAGDAFTTTLSNFPELNAGIYILSVYTGSEAKSVRLVVQ